VKMENEKIRDRERERERVNWHLRVAVCRTLRGIRRHLSVFPLEDLALLCRYLNCSVENIDFVMFEMIKKREFI